MGLTLWACFGSFLGAAEAALFSGTQYGSYNGISGVSAGHVLGQQLRLFLELFVSLLQLLGERLDRAGRDREHHEGRDHARVLS